MFWVRVVFLKAFFVKTVKFFGSPSALHRMERMRTKGMSNENPFRGIEGVLNGGACQEVDRTPGEIEQENIKGFVWAYVRSPVCHQTEMLDGKSRFVRTTAELSVGHCARTFVRQTDGRVTFRVFRIFFKSVKSEWWCRMDKRASIGNGDSTGVLKQNFPKSG